VTTNVNRRSAWIKTSNSVLSTIGGGLRLDLSQQNEQRKTWSDRRLSLIDLWRGSIFMLLICCAPLAIFGAQTTTSEQAALSAPAPGSQLTGASITFSWTAGQDVRRYKLSLGSTGAGSDNLYNSGPTTATSVLVSGLPTNGESIYAELSSEIEGKGWISTNYVFTAFKAVPSLSVNAASIAFGNVNLKTPTTQSVTLTSTGGSPVTVNSATVSGTGFSMSSGSFPVTLNPNQIATVSVEFDPTTAGAATGALTIASSSSSDPTATVSLSGTGVTASTSSGQSVINCPSGFASSGSCGVSFIYPLGEPLAVVGTTNGSTPALSGSMVDLLPTGTVHAALSLNYQAAQVNDQAFVATFTFVPNGWNLAFVLNNSDNNPDFNGKSFSAGAGCEAGFFQAFSQPAPPNNLFALELDSYDYLTVSGPFANSSAQIYQAGQNPCLPNWDNAPNYTAIDKISTSPVDLDIGSDQGTSTGDTYSATITYNGSSLTLDLYDVTTGGSCPGSSCFTYTWNDVNIPTLVGGNTAWVGVTGATNQASTYPLYIKSLTYSVESPQ
jgi:Abnormal spindle-like microcephaly-assoc'd, ASPM-SPD-2-Hydin